MRVLLVLCLAAMPSLAYAKPELKCEFEGNKTKVSIVNPDNKRAFCHYNCNYQLENGAGADVGSTAVAAGETKVVSEDTHKSKVTGVNTKKLECE